MKLRFLPLIAVLALGACDLAGDGFSVPVQNGPVRVGFGVRNGGGIDITKTSVDSDGLSVSWEPSDIVRLWARDAAGNKVIDNRPFRMYGSYGGTAVFTSELPEAMSEGEYRYYACYPEPVSINGTTAVFRLPAEQDGKASGGADIMVCGPVTGPRLEAVKTDGGTRYEDYSGVTLPMRHLVHLLKFFLPESTTGFGGEGVRRIEFNMPCNVVGNVGTDISNPYDIPTLSDASSSVRLELTDPIYPSPADGSRDYACAAIFPSGFADDAVMSLKLYTDNWIGIAKDIRLGGRNFLEGHSTPVSVSIAEYIRYYAIRLKLAGNNLGEPVRKITLSLPEGLHLGDGGSNVSVYDPGRDIGTGEEIELLYYDKADFDALSGRTLELTYESAHAITHQTIALGDLSSVNSVSFTMTVPYLLFEDFSSVGSFSSYDGYSTANAGNKDAVSFLNGWSGGRIGASAGNCIRIAGRRECGLFIDAHYPARVDSAPIARITSPVDVEVTFDYGTDNDYTTIPVSGDVGQYIYLGYVTRTDKYSSGSTAGTFEEANTINTSEKGGSWTLTPNTVSMTIHGMPAGTTNRISWRNDPEGKSDFGSNTTSWCYIDNVKVKIKNR